MTRPVAEDAAFSSARQRFEQLYEEHFQAIYAYVLRRRRTEEVGDLVAETFTVAWRRIADVPQPPDDKLWLYGVARRVLSQDGRASLRRLSLFNHLAESSPLSVDATTQDESDSTSRVRELIAHLKPLDQEIVRLVAWEALSHAEIARILDCSTNTVAVRWHRSIGRLRKALGISASRHPDSGSSRKEASHDS